MPLRCCCFGNIYSKEQREAIATAEDIKEKNRLVQNYVINCRRRHINIELDGLDLSGVDFTDLDLSKLTHTYMKEFTDEDGSKYYRQVTDVWVKVYLDDSILVGANLQGVNFTQAKLKDANLEGADIRGAWFNNADLRGCNLLDTIQDDETVLAGAKMNKKTLQGASAKAAAVVALSVDADLVPSSFSSSSSHQAGHTATT